MKPLSECCGCTGWHLGLVPGLGGLTLWLTVGKVALFQACFVRLNLYKYSYYFQLWLLSTPVAFTVCHVSSVMSSSSRQNQTSAGGAACFRLPWLDVPQRTHRRPSSPKSLTPTSEASPSSSVHFAALAMAPPSRVVNMVNKQEESAEDYTWRG